MRRGESLVQVDVHHVEAHISGPACTEHRVQVCPVVVHQCAAAMHQFRYLGDALLEEAESVRVGHHHCGHSVVEQAAQVVDIHRAVRATLHLDDIETAHRSRSGIGAMCRVGHYDLCAFHVSPTLVICLNDHQSCKFAMRSGIRFKRKCGHSCYCLQCSRQHRAHRFGTLYRISRLKRVQICKLGHGCHLLVYRRIVFHCAAAKRIKTVVHAEVVGTVICIMAHDGKFIALRQMRFLLAAHLCRNLIISKTVFRQRIAASSFL